MNTKQAIAIVALGLVATGGYVFLVNKDNSVTFCNPNGNCYTFTPTEYTTEFQRLVAKSTSVTPITMDEYQLLVQMYNRQIKQQHGIQISNYKFRTNNLQKVNAKINLLQVQ